MKRFFIVHPFIQSDNRHFVFYLFKDIILVCERSSMVSDSQPFKYLLVPIFALCICIMISMVTEELSGLTSLILAVLFGVVIVSSPVVEYQFLVKYTLISQIPLLYIACRSIYLSCKATHASYHFSVCISPPQSLHCLSLPLSSFYMA